MAIMTSCSHEKSPANASRRKYDVLSFDVYNPAEKPIDFAVRVDDASKQGQFIMTKRCAAVFA
jgi:hypothetical protein